MSFKFKRLKISDVVLIEPEIFENERGFLAEKDKILPSLREAAIKNGH